MSPLVVRIRVVKPVPGAVVMTWTVLAATSRSLAFTVVTAPVVVVVPEPVCCAVTSTGEVGSSPLYSTTRTSGDVAVVLKATVTTFADEPAMFFA
jgi:hypothetical protein